MVPKVRGDSGRELPGQRRRGPLEVEMAQRGTEGDDLWLRRQEARGSVVAVGVVRVARSRVGVQSWHLVDVCHTKETRRDARVAWDRRSSINCSTRTASATTSTCSTTSCANGRITTTIIAPTALSMDKRRTNGY